MLHLGVLVKDHHQRTVEMLIDYAAVVIDVSSIHLHIIDNNSKYYYRAYFFEGLPWASIRVHRSNEQVDVESAVHLIKPYTASGDSISLTVDCKSFESLGIN